MEKRDRKADILTDFLETRETLRFDDISEVEEYVTKFNKFELLFRELWLSGVLEPFWEHPTRELERDFWMTNIYVTHHFRYDFHEIHCHDYFQLCHCLGGECTITLHGGDLPLKNGDILLLAPKTHHRLNVFSDDCHIIKLYVRKSTFDRAFFSIIGEDNLLSNFFRSSIYCGCPESYVLFAAPDDRELKETILKLYREVINREAYSPTFLDALLTEFFCRLMRKYVGTARLVSDDIRRGATVGSMIHNIRENYATLTLNEAASAAGYSRSQFCSIIKTATGKTFTGLINDARIEAAAKLLATSDLTVTEIGLRVGFNSNEHFHRIFRRVKNLSPKEWRDEARRKACDDQTNERRSVE